MELVHQVLTANDIEEILALEEARLAVSIPDATERTFASWQAKWRRESLEHYLKLGWSFACRRSGSQAIVGFFLAQPLLFFRGQTQTVWVEYLSYPDDVVRNSLIEVAVKVGREKHMQRVLFADSRQHQAGLEIWKAGSLADDIAEVKTTKG